MDQILTTMKWILWSNIDRNIVSSGYFATIADYIMSVNSELVNEELLSKPHRNEFTTMSEQINIL
jgi:hypothetical protein